MKECMKEEDCCILLTCTVTPNAWAGALQNPTMRRAQYLEAIDYYLTVTRAKIVIVENSGAQELKQSTTHHDITDRLEFCIYKDNPEEFNSNRGYKEMKMLEYAWQHSCLLPRSKVIIKVTGRLKCLNIINLIHHLPLKQCYISAIIYPPHKYSDSRTFAITYNAGKYLFRYREDIGTIGIFENALCKAVLTRPANCTFVFLPVYPKISGISGGDGRNYNEDLSPTRLLQKWLKYWGKRLLTQHI